VSYFINKELNQRYESHENILNRRHIDKIEYEKFEYKKEQDKYKSIWFSGKNTIDFK
jgi:hypothetical protein